MKVKPNDQKRAGQRASAITFFGEASRFALFAVHTRFDAVQWFVTDAEVTDEVTGRAEVIRQAATPEEALRGLGLREAGLMTAAKKEALRLMAEGKHGALLVGGFGWAFPQHVRESEVVALAVVAQIGGGN